MKDEQAKLDELTQKIVEAGLASWSGGETDQRRLIVRGQAHLLDDLKALEDLERFRLLFEDLETRREVVDLLGRAEQAEGVRIFIGSENKLFSLSGSSTVISPYRDAAGLDRRRARRDRPDAAQLRPRHPDGRLHRQGGRQADFRLVRKGFRRSLDFCRISPDMRGIMSDTTRLPRTTHSSRPIRPRGRRAEPSTRSTANSPIPRTGCCARWPRWRICASGPSARSPMRGSTAFPLRARYAHRRRQHAPGAGGAGRPSCGRSPTAASRRCSTASN